MGKLGYSVGIIEGFPLKIVLGVDDSLSIWPYFGIFHSISGSGRQ